MTAEQAKILSALATAFPPLERDEIVRALAVSSVHRAYARQLLEAIALPEQPGKPDPTVAGTPSVETIAPATVTLGPSRTSVPSPTLTSAQPGVSATLTEAFKPTQSPGPDAAASPSPTSTATPRPTTTVGPTETPWPTVALTTPAPPTNTSIPPTAVPTSPPAPTAVPTPPPAPTAANPWLRGRARGRATPPRLPLPAPPSTDRGAGRSRGPIPPASL